MYCGEKWNWRHSDGEEQADVNDLSCHLRPCDVQVCAAATEGHIWVPRLIAMVVCVDVSDSCYHQRPYVCSWSGLLPKAMLMSEGHTEQAFYWSWESWL